MAVWQMPYQRLQRSGNILLAARGSSIDTFDLNSGSFLSSWSTAPETTEGSIASTPQVSKSSTPPAKRRKVAEEENVAGSVTVEQTNAEIPVNGNGNGVSKAEKKKQQNQKSRAESASSGLEHPAVICLAATDDGKHVVAVTAEDKSIRVLEHVKSADGKQQLRQISIRQMPKRPCQIRISPDSQTIYSADKFGDVYTLSLFPAPETETISTTQTSTPEPARPWQPAANEFTIHSKRNRDALEQQRKHKTAPNAAENKTFAGKLVLGHVSMLTDMIFGQLDGKEYIITADRDEHIRVTRGGDQTHVIESFCLGHEEYVTRLCIPSCRPDILISGGGDGDLYLWEWKTGKLITKVDLKYQISHSMTKGSVLHEESNTEDHRVVVSNIVYFRNVEAEVETIVVTVEGARELLFYKLQMDERKPLEFIKALPLIGNPLDFLMYTPDGSEAKPRMIISQDTVTKTEWITGLQEEEPALPDVKLRSTSREETNEETTAGEVGTEEKTEESSNKQVCKPLVSYEFGDVQFRHVKGLEFEENKVDVEKGNVNVQKLMLLLYPLRSLRKRDEGDDKGEADD